MNEVEKNMAVSALAQLLDQQPTAYAEVLAACRAMGWNASPTAQPADIIDELPSNVLPFIRRMLALLIYGDGSADSPAVVPVTDRCYAQLVPRVTSPNYPAAGFPTAPSALSPMTPSIRDFAHLEQALSALSARKISDLGDCPDGISFVHLAAGYTGVTELCDDNRGWTMSRSLPTMSSVTKATIGCKTLHAAISNSLPNAEELNFPDLDHIDTGETGAPQTNLIYGAAVKKVNMPALKRFLVVNASYSGVFYNLTSPCEILAENCTYWDSRRGGGYPVGLHTVPGLTRLVVGTMTYFCPLTSASGATSLIDIEIGQGTACNLYLEYWSPTLDSSNLDQFLQNFRSHIALRLTDNGSGKTLTLSQAVYDAIKDETHLFVFDEGTMTIYAYLTNIKHWTVTK